MTGPTEIESLAEALVEANDVLLGLYDLADATSHSLDEGRVVHDILRRAADLVAAERLTLTTERGRVSVGNAVADAMRSTTVTATHGLGLTGELEAVRADAAFTTGDRKLLSTVLQTILTAIETARLHARSVETAVVARETERAAEIAQLAMPSARPDIDGVDVFFRNEQARNTGGDLFCFHVSGDRLSFAVGDVTGKGLSAAVMMTTAVCAARAAFRDTRATTPGEELVLINDWMHDHLSDAELFMSMFIGHYEQGKAELSWSNAGHSPCVVASVGGATDLPALMPPLGVLESLEATTRRLALEQGDVVVIGSDGIIEQPSMSGEAFGEARFQAVLGAVRRGSSSVIGSSLLEAVHRYAGNAPQSDDRTVIVLRHETQESR